MDVLKFIGEAPVLDGVLNYEMLEETMNKVFGCFSVYDSGNTANKRSCLYLCVMADDGWWKMFKNGDKSYIRNNNILSPILNKNHLKLNLRVSKKISKPNRATVSITDYLDSTQLYSMIYDGDDYQKEFFTKIFQDVSVIPNLKQDEEYKKLFDHYKMNQTMISEFYKDTPSSIRYPHKKDEMEKIDCLIIDIDDSITYKEFAEIYSDYEYMAYPSVSNPNHDNWRKFRVIFPLKHTLSIPNESLAVLKLLRRMVCKYEDKNHQLGSYINKEQWDMRIDHEGSPIDISQGTVTYLNSLIKSLKTYMHKFKKRDDGKFTIADWWSLDTAIAYYEKAEASPEEGARHFALYPIKNHLSDEDCVEFEKWLSENHPDKLKHWKTHKRIVA